MASIRPPFGPARRTSAAVAEHPLNRLPRFGFIDETVAVGIDLIEPLSQLRRGSVFPGFLLADFSVLVSIDCYPAFAGLLDESAYLGAIRAGAIAGPSLTRTTGRTVRKTGEQLLAAQLAVFVAVE